MIVGNASSSQRIRQARRNRNEYKIIEIFRTEQSNNLTPDIGISHAEALLRLSCLGDNARMAKLADRNQAGSEEGKGTMSIINTVIAFIIGSAAFGIGLCSYTLWLLITGKWEDLGHGAGGEK